MLPGDSCSALDAVAVEPFLRVAPVKTAITLTCSAEIRFPAMPHLLGPCPSILATCRLRDGGPAPPLVLR